MTKTSARVCPGCGCASNHNCGDGSCGNFRACRQDGALRRIDRASAASDAQQNSDTRLAS